MPVTIDSLDSYTAGQPYATDSLSNEDYHAERDHISRSVAYRYAATERGALTQHYEDKRGKPVFTGNAATTLGSIVDAAVGAVAAGIEYRSVLCCPPRDVLSAAGRRQGKAYTEWRDALPKSAIECTEEDVVRVGEMIDSLLMHDEARRLIETCKSTQRSVFWTDADGHRRKARADGVCESGQWWDLKTTSDIDRCRYSVTDYGYHWQAKWYCDARDAAARQPLGFEFPFVFVETRAPWMVRVITLSPEQLDAAGDEIRETLNAIKSRRESGVYLPESYHSVRSV